MICRKSADTGRVRTRTRTDGHRFLNVCHTKAPKGATRLHPQGKGGPFRDSCVEDVWRQSDVDHDFSSAKSWIFLFLHCAYGPTCEKSWFLGHIYFAKRFLFFLPKNLMWSRLHGIKSQFGFSTFHFLKFCLSIWTQKSCHGRDTPCMIWQKIRTYADGRTDGRTSIFKRLPHKSP